MLRKIELQELSVVVAADSLNPSILNPDFLRYNEIVPASWELAGSPLTTEAVSQVVYKNKLSVLAQPNRIIFTEKLGGKDLKSLSAPSIALKYVVVLPHTPYTAVGLNPKGHVLFGTEEEANQYVTRGLLKEGPWMHVTDSLLHANVRFTYSFESFQLNIDVQPALIKAGEELAFPIVVFAGNFHFDLEGAIQDKRLSHLHEILTGWQDRISMFRDLVNEQFLSKAKEQ